MAFCRSVRMPTKPAEPPSLHAAAVLVQWVRDAHWLIYRGPPPDGCINGCWAAALSAHSQAQDATELQLFLLLAISRLNQPMAALKKSWIHSTGLVSPHAGQRAWAAPEWSTLPLEFQKFHSFFPFSFSRIPFSLQAKRAVQSVVEFVCECG